MWLIAATVFFALAGTAVAADPDAGQTAHVSLAELLRYASQHSPFLLAGRARAAGKEIELQAARPLFPTGATLEVAAGPRVASAGKSLDLELSLEQPIEVSGARGLHIVAAERSLQLAETRFEELRWSVHRRIHALFHSALIAGKHKAAADQLLRFTEHLLDVARRRLRAGDISPLQVRVAEVELAQARQARIAAESAYRSALLSLAELSGWDPENPPEPFGRLDEPKPPPPLEKLLTMALRHHPGLRTQIAAVREAEAQTALVQRQGWPTPALGLHYAQESSPKGGPPEHVGLLGLTIHLPWGRERSGELAKARVALEIARASQHAMRSSLRVQVIRAASAVSAEAQRVAAYGKEIIPAFEKNLDLLRRSFELGEIGLLEVLVARGRFLRVGGDALKAHDEYYDAVSELESVVGTEIWKDDHDDHGDEQVAAPEEIRP